MTSSENLKTSKCGTMARWVCYMPSVDYMHDLLNIGLCLTVFRCTHLLEKLFILFYSSCVYLCFQKSAAVCEDLSSVKGKACYLTVCKYLISYECFQQFPSTLVWDVLFLVTLIPWSLLIWSQTGQIILLLDSVCMSWLMLCILCFGCLHFFSGLLWCSSSWLC